MRSLLQTFVLVAFGCASASQWTRIQAAEAAAHQFNVQAHGAVGDGVTLDTAAINRAVDACAQSGGGEVLLPAGRFLSGTIHLRSHVTLVLSPGARLIGTTNL